MTPGRGAGQRLINFSTTRSGSSKMHTMYEALARDRMRETCDEAHQRRAMHELSAVRRWQRLQRRAEAAERRVHAAQRRNALTAV